MDPLSTFVADPKRYALLKELELGHTFHEDQALPFYEELENAFKELVFRKMEEAIAPVVFTPSSELTKDQNDRIQASINKSLIIITGGPGTGKTYTAAKLVHQLKSSLKHIIFAAPTGKAAQRLKESFKSEEVEALTLHRLLGKEDDLIKLPYDLLIVDEASMIDLKMMIHLLKSIKKGARLLLLGDVNQLPPVEAGAPFQALVELYEKKWGITPLKECLRSDLKNLKQLSDYVVQGNSQEALALLEQNHSEIQLKELSIPPKYPVLTPLKQGPFGVQKLNRWYLSKHLSPVQPIMVTENNDDLGLYNGDIGFLDGQGKATFQNKTFPEKICPRFELAFSLSIHKSQGSEFEEVHIVLPEGSEVFGRNLLYTAITRAKKKLVIYSSKETLKKTIEASSKRRVKPLME